MIQKIKYTLKNLKFIKRETIVFFVFFLWFIILISSVFYYTVFEHKYYKALADNQQIGKVEIPVTRGNIYTNNSNVLATSVSLNDLAIDPMGEGDEEKLIVFLRGIIFTELCVQKNQKKCKQNLKRFLRVLTLEDFEYSEKYILNKITEFLKQRLKLNKITSVLLYTNLTDKQSAKIISLGLEGVYVTDGNLFINPEKINNKKYVAKELSKVISILEIRIQELIRKRYRRYTPIISKLSIESSEKIEKYLKEERDAYRRGILDGNEVIFKYIILTPFPQRFYPEGQLASQVLGFLNNRGRGQYGLEGYFDEILKGNKGYIIARRDVRGRTINPISLEKGELFGKGAKIYSTIDRNVQAKVEKVLEKGVKEFRANKGSVIVMNPKTGKIISMANYPSYNPNRPGNVYELEKVNHRKYKDPIIDLKGIPVFVEDSINGKEFLYNSEIILLREATEQEIGNPIIIKYKYVNKFGPAVYRNGAISYLFEPGSIMKAFTVAIGLDTGEITQNSMYQDDGSLTIDQFTISNVSRKCLGYHTFGNALTYSCNVGMIRIAQRYGRVIAYNYLKAFGFDQKTGISLFGEVTANIRELNNWSISNLLTSSYGLGISVTPLQMATAYSILANGGVYIRPYIVDRIVYSNGKILEYRPEKTHRVIKPKTSRIITKMLVDSVKTGGVEGFNLAGKSGTSQIASRGGYETGQASTYASFAGFGPAEDPKFVIIVKLVRPRTSIYGGATAALIFRDIAEFLFDYYKIPKKPTN